MVRRVVPMREAKERLPGLVREVAKGARLTITVHGRPLADLVPHVEEPPEIRPPRSMPTRVNMKPGLSVDEILDELRGDR